MKQSRLTLPLILCGSVLSSLSFAQAPLKDELESVKDYNWSGLYAGLNIGAVKHTLTITDNQATSFYGTIQQVSNPDFTGGFQVGYRRQLDPTRSSGVYGLEFTADFSNAAFAQIYGSPFALYQLDSENKLKDVCLLQFIGGISAGRSLIFLAAGASWTNISGDVTNMDSLPFFNSFSVSNNGFGTAVGAGVEYAFSHSFSARFKVDFITPNTYTNSDNLGDNFQISNDIVLGTLGVNYRFG